ncbi:diguanylate cyclase domain-containing protein [Pinisolibacter sp.]|uniref:diguanylate cyclase domain-containing protein n=1 Tax=Pinisolibacter sp. TaxID=2172024 RepID=UPI002FDCC849
MSYRGRVLVIEESPRPETRLLWDGIRAEGWDVHAVPLARTVDQTVAGHPDLVVLNLAGAGGDVARTRYLDAAARMSLLRATRRTPVIAVDDGELVADERPIGVADVIRAPWSVGHVAARIGSLTRLATMRAEIYRRLDTAQRYGLSQPDLELSASLGDAHVLVVGAGIRYFTIEKALSKRATLVGAFTIETALDYLERRPFDAVVLNLPLDDAIDFVEVLRRNPAWFALPVVVLTGDTEPRMVEAVHEAGASDVVFADESERVFADRVEAAMSEHRLRETLKAAYSRARHQATNDSLTGLYTRGFLMDHLGLLVGDARDTGERLTLVGLRMMDMAETNAEWGWAGGDHLIRQVGSLIGRLVRGEDLAARAGGDRFALVLPATDGEDAARVAHRIAGVIETTAFTVPDATGPVYVSIIVGIAECEPDDDPDSLYARVFAAPEA